MEKLRLLTFAACFVGLAFVLGTMFGMMYTRTTLASEHQTFLTVREKASLYVIQSFSDSVAFEIAASKAHFTDYPEEQPDDGDELCAYVRADTIFVEYWQDLPHQKRYFRYFHGF